MTFLALKKHCFLTARTRRATLIDSSGSLPYSSVVGSQRRATSESTAVSSITVRDFRLTVVSGHSPVQADAMGSCPLQPSQETRWLPQTEQRSTSHSFL